MNLSEEKMRRTFVKRGIDLDNQVADRKPGIMRNYPSISQVATWMMLCYAAEQTKRLSE